MKETMCFVPKYAYVSLELISQTLAYTGSLLQGLWSIATDSLKLILIATNVAYFVNPKWQPNNSKRTGIGK